MREQRMGPAPYQVGLVVANDSVRRISREVLDGASANGAVVTSLGTSPGIVSLEDAAAGGWAARLFLVARMAGVVLLCTWLLRRDGERRADLGLRRPRHWWAVPILVVGGFALLAVLTGLLQPLLPALGAELPRTTRFPPWAEAPMTHLFWAVPVAWGSAAFGEELLARGFLLDRIRKVLGASGLPATLLAVVLQALVFGAFHFHQGIGGVLWTSAIALGFGLVWLAGGQNLWASILLHGLVDFLHVTGL